MKSGAGRRGPGARSIIALLPLLLASCARFQPLPVLGSVPDFQLTSQSGEPFDSSSLAGHVWVADFIYTTCTGPCPMMSYQMGKLQAATRDLPDLRLVSFTVDPQHDTPAVLAAYSRNFKADLRRWSFLTGDQARLSAVGLKGFHLNVVDGSLVHSTRFALVDREARIRGYYSTGDNGFMKDLLRDIRRLENEPS